MGRRGDQYGLRASAPLRLDDVIFEQRGFTSGDADVVLMSSAMAIGRSRRVLSLYMLKAMSCIGAH